MALIARLRMFLTARLCMEAGFEDLFGRLQFQHWFPAFQVKTKPSKAKLCEDFLLAPLFLIPKSMSLCQVGGSWA